MKHPLKCFLVGKSGKMGKALQEAISQNEDFLLAPSLTQADAAIDFSSPEGTLAFLKTAPHIPLVVGTTGHTQQELAFLKKASSHIPLLLAPNFSLLLPICLEAVRHIRPLLPENTWMNIVETHHIHKKDAPSGTALTLKAALQNEDVLIHSIRSADVIGEHTLIFEIEGERLTFSHTVRSRSAFAKGALQAALWLSTQPKGFYKLEDFLNLALKS